MGSPPWIMNPFMFLCFTAHPNPSTCGTCCCRSSRWHTTRGSSILHFWLLRSHLRVLGYQLTEQLNLEFPQVGVHCQCLCRHGACIYSLPWWRVVEVELSEDNDAQKASAFERTNIDSYQIENKHHQLSNRLRLRVEHLVRSEGLGRRIERALLVDHVHVCHVSH